jgi:hypothetical protein
VCSSDLSLSEGTYTESLRIDKDVVIQGPDITEGASPTVTLLATPGLDTLTLSSSRIFFRNLIIGVGDSATSSAVALLSGTSIFENCEITCPYLPPIATRSDGLLHFISTTITSGDSSLAHVSGSVGVDFLGCTLSSPHSNCIFASGQSRVRLRSTTLSHCGDTCIVMLDSSGLEVHDSEFTDNCAHAILLQSTFSENVISNTKIAAHEKGAAIFCRGPGAASVSECAIEGCVSGIVAIGGYRLECSANTVTSTPESALVFAVSGSTVALQGDTLTGDCLAAVYVTSRAKVTANDVTVSDVTLGFRVIGNKSPVTSPSVADVTSLSVAGGSFERVDMFGIEVHDQVDLEIDGASFGGPGKAGLFIDRARHVSVTNSVFSGFTDAGIHVTECEADVTFRGCQFAECRSTEQQTTGASLRKTHAAFEDCVFERNVSGEDLEKSVTSGAEIRYEASVVSFNGCRFAGNDNGAISIEYASATFTSCVFEDNETAMYLSGGYLKLNACILRRNRRYGICADNCGDGSANGCEITGGQCGVVLYTVDTKLALERCQIADCSQCGLLVGTSDETYQGGRATLTECIVCRNRANVVVDSGGAAVLERCKVLDSVGGVGVRAFGTGSSFECRASTLGPETQLAVLVEGEAKGVIEGCEIHGCGTCGVVLKGNAGGAIRECVIHDITKVGIQIEGGNASIRKNTIKNCGSYPIHMEAVASPEIGENVYEGNFEDAVHRA